MPHAYCRNWGSKCQRKGWWGGAVIVVLTRRKSKRFLLKDREVDAGYKLLIY